MHTGAVLPLDDGPLPADRLNGVETAVPNGHTGQGEGALQISLHGLQKVPSDHQAHQRRHDGGHGQHFPVALVDEKANLLAQIDGNLAEAPPVAKPPPNGGLRAQLSHVAPPHTSE